MTLEQLNALQRDEFTDTLGAIFEHSPWVAERAWEMRPFASVSTLHAAMCASVAASDDAMKLALIRAHPPLAGKAALRDELTDASKSEQHAAGLDQCSPEQLSRLTELTRDYDRRFGFPFILAVRDHTRQGILDHLTARMGNTREQEIAEALRQIERIALLRLTGTIAG
ncbi:MAG: 2-oxo-4-hydroxy-4-carboxy-5-ureidoimidazoline decarboxylase [Arenimonas sp.]|jgi:2-oxo-4-hydroxy-4-carboxy-5-ureidoimidazoline decarboxylase